MNRLLSVVAPAVAALLFAIPAEAQANSGSAAASNVVTLTAPPNPRARLSHGFGIAMNPGPNNAYTHAYVIEVEPGSAAARAGLVVGDTILASDGNDVRGRPLFPEPRAGKRYVLRVRRNGEERELTYVYPSPPAAPQPPASAHPE